MIQKVDKTFYQEKMKTSDLKKNNLLWRNADGQF